MGSAFNFTAARFVDIFLGLPSGGDVCRQEVAGFTSFVDTFVDIGEGTGLALLVGFVRQLLKLNSK
jgi:hypothetical protein